MKRIKIEEKKNGYMMTVDGFIYAQGEYVYKSTEVMEMVEKIGELLNDYKVEVKRK